MKFTLSIAAAALCVTALHATPALARDTVYLLPLQEVLDMPEAKEKLDGSVRFFLSGQKTPKVLETKDSDVSNRKTNGVGKSDEDACRWAALSALLAFRDKAGKTAPMPWSISSATTRRTRWRARPTMSATPARWWWALP